MTTEVDLCNMAIASAGSQDLISDLNEDSAEAKLCNLFYSQVRDGLLRKGTYTIARYTAVLNRLSSGFTLPQQWLYAYGLPSDCLRVFALTERYVDPNTVPKVFSIDNVTYSVPEIDIPLQPYELSSLDDKSQPVLFANITPAFLLYARQITNPALFDQGLQDAIVTVLASKICYPLTNKVQRSKDLAAMARGVMDEAEAEAANEQGDTYDFIPIHIQER